MYLTNQHGLDRGNKGYGYAECTHIVSCITCTLHVICILSIVIFAYYYNLQSCTLIAMFCKHTHTHTHTRTHTHTTRKPVSFFWRDSSGTCIMTVSSTCLKFIHVVLLLTVALEVACHSSRVTCYSSGSHSSSSHVSRITPVNFAATRATCHVSLQ